MGEALFIGSDFAIHGAVTEATSVIILILLHRDLLHRKEIEPCA